MAFSFFLKKAKISKTAEEELISNLEHEKHQNLGEGGETPIKFYVGSQSQGISNIYRSAVSILANKRILGFPERISK
jgi:hypothetical protein